MKSAFRMDDMDIELSLPNEDDEEEMKPENVSSFEATPNLLFTKAAWNSSFPPNACCGNHKQGTDYVWRFGHCCTHSVYMQQMRLPMGMG